MSFFQNYYRETAKAAIAKANCFRKLNHQGVKGAILEVLIKELFRPLLPPNIGVGSGQIISHDGSIPSNEIDIIIYDKSILPPLLVDNSLGLFPVECVLYTIEVKTTLDKRGLQQAHDSGKKVDGFTFLSGIRGANGESLAHYVKGIVPAIFALSSDASNKSEAKRYQEIYSKEKGPIVKDICVANKGYWRDDGDKWVRYDSDKECSEVLSFIGLILNSYKEISDSRKNPLLGNYLIPENDVVAEHFSRQLYKARVTCKSCGADNESYPKFDLTQIRGHDIENGEIFKVNNEDDIQTIEKCECGSSLVLPGGEYKLRRHSRYYELAEDVG